MSHIDYNDDRSKPESGFTLVEILIVLAILVLLGTVAIIALNPADHLATARDDVRESHVHQIWRAANEKRIQDGDWDCQAGTLPQQLDSDSKPIFVYIGTGSEDYDLFSCLYLDHLPNILVDPTEGQENGLEDYFSGYQVWQHPVTRHISIYAPHRETRSLAQGYDPESDSPVEITSTNVLEGWAWNDHFGWLSVSATTGGGEIDYGGEILESDDLSGYAWLRGVEAQPAGLGWLKFDAQPDGAESFPNCPASTCPDGSPDHSSRINWETGKITGWARFCSGTVDNDCDSASRDDWNGWVLLGPLEKDSVDHGLGLSGDQSSLIGWAWAGEPVGWISFSCENEEVCGTSDYRVELEAVHPD